MIQRVGTGCRSELRLVFLILLMILLPDLSPPAVAQDLSPRAYWPAPTGTKVVSFGYAFQTGDIVTDPSLPIEGSEAELHGLQVGYLQVFGLAGRTANVSLEVPRADATFQGTIDGELAKRDLDGLADISLRFAINLRGAPVMTPQQFQAFRQAPKPVLGLSLEIQPPTGQYDPDRLVNLGTNRWAFKPELGYLHPIRPGYIAEFVLGAWLYTDNDEFQGEIRKQAPLINFQFHLVRRVRPGFWAALDLNYFFGGRTTVGGETMDDRLRNSRIGATIVFPFSHAQAVRLAASTSLTTESGGDYDSYLVSYLKAWR